MLDKFQRIQKHYYMHDMYPYRNDGLCACGCGIKLTGRQSRWASKECSEKAYNAFAIIKGSADIVRKNLFQIDKGACRNCGEITDNWEADHILPVHKGGGACGIDNYQSLCYQCHKEKTFGKK